MAPDTAAMRSQDYPGQAAGATAPVIVVGLDGSPAGWDAFCWAAGAAARGHGRLIAVYATPAVEPLAVPDVPFDYAAAEQAWRETAGQLADEAAQRASDVGVPLSFVRESGDVVRALTSVARAVGADLVVVGRSAKILGRLSQPAARLPRGCASNRGRALTALQPMTPGLNCRRGAAGPNTGQVTCRVPAQQTPGNTTVAVRRLMAQRQRPARASPVPGPAAPARPVPFPRWQTSPAPARRGHACRTRPRRPGAPAGTPLLPHGARCPAGRTGPRSRPCRAHPAWRRRWRPAAAPDTRHRRSLVSPAGGPPPQTRRATAPAPAGPGPVESKPMNSSSRGDAQHRAPHLVSVADVSYSPDHASCLQQANSRPHPRDHQRRRAPRSHPCPGQGQLPGSAPRQVVGGGTGSLLGPATCPRG